MERELILPIPSFEKREPFTRGNKGFIAVYGINDRGFAYSYIEEADLDSEYNLTVRWIPSSMATTFDDYGTCRPITTYWRKTYLSNGKVVKVDFSENPHMDTNHPDMIAFTAGLGVKMIPSILNGKVRAIDGFDNQPIFAQDGSKIDDSNYDTTAEPTFTYMQREPTYAPEPTPEPTSGTTEG
jgi:hypothetical protein